MSDDFRIVPASARWLLIIGGIAILIPFTILISLFIVDGKKVMDPLAIGIVIASMLLLAGVLSVVFRSARSAIFEISSEGLRLKGDFFGRLIPLATLEIERGRIIDLSVDKEFKPRWKTCGSSFPGYQSGWFRLRNKEKALLYLTDQKKVVHLPTKKGYCLLLSPANPERFLEVLKRYRL